MRKQGRGYAVRCSDSFFLVRSSRSRALIHGRPSSMNVRNQDGRPYQLDCLQPAFSLKIRLVLISAGANANHDVMSH